MSKKHKKKTSEERQVMPVYVVHYLIKDGYIPDLYFIKGVYERRDEALEMVKALEDLGIEAGVTISQLWKKETKK